MQCIIITYLFMPYLSKKILLQVADKMMATQCKFITSDILGAKPVLQVVLYLLQYIYHKNNLYWHLFCIFLLLWMLMCNPHPLNLFDNFTITVINLYLETTLGRWQTRGEACPSPCGQWSLGQVWQDDGGTPKNKQCVRRLQLYF